MVFGTRVPSSDLAALPELAVGGLPDADARVLLESALAGPVDARVRDQIVAETHGNPLAILELPRGLSAAELAGGFGLPGALPATVALPGRVEESFRQRVRSLPEQTRRLLLLAAADPAGDPALVWRAAASLGIPAQAATAAADGGLMEFGRQVLFRHPLVRSAAYRSASPRDRQDAHRALAEATDPHLDPDRRAWHRAQAASAPDEDVAAELESSAGRAQARGGFAAAAAFLKQSAMLTPEPARRAGRALDAAQAKTEAGAFDEARDLLAMAETGPLTDLQRARVELVRARLAYVTSKGNDAPPLLLQAARRLEPIDVDLSREAYLDALAAAMFAGRLAGPGGGVLEVARAASAAPRPVGALRAPDLLLDGLAAHYNQGYSVGVPVVQRALAAFGTAMSAEEELRWLWLAYVSAAHVWDDDRWEALSSRYFQLARQVGALSELPLALSARAHRLVFAGELNAAASVVQEMQVAIEATGSNLAPYGALALAAFRGDEATAITLIETTLKEVTLRGEGIGITVAEWANALLNNGLGRYRQALAAAQRATGHDSGLGRGENWAVAELIEAAARSGMTETVADAYQRLAEMTSAAGTDWALGIRARSHALLSEGQVAERLYREAIARLGRTRIRVDLARAHLLYGEWLRRERRRSEAREQLRTALGMLEAMGVEGFAERARRELRASGETARRRTAAAGDEELTTQEAQIGRMARDGLSNPEIGARLFISTRTVQYHLRKVFAKLGISSRAQLDRVLPDGPASARSR